MGAVDQVRRLRGNIVPLGVHGVLLHIVHLDGTEGAQPDMQGHKADVHAFRAHLIEELRGKVQPRRRRRRRALVFCVHGLIAVSVLQLVGDVGRQGHLAQPVQHLLEDALELKSHQAVAALRDLQDLRLEAPVAKDGPGARPQLFARPHQALPDIRLQPFEQEDLHSRPGPLAGPQEPGRDHLGIIEDHGVPGLQIFQDIAEGAMGPLSCPPVQHQEPGRRAVLQGILRDQLLRQVKIVVRGAVPEGHLARSRVFFVSIHIKTKYSINTGFAR